MLEFVRIIPYALMLEFPIVLCFLALIIYSIGLKIGVFKE